MTDVFSYILATLVTIPIIGYIIIFTICKQMTRNHRRSVLIALDLSTLLVIFSVHYMIVAIWEQSYFWVILLVMLNMAIIYVLFYWKTKKEIDFLALFRGYWRLNFLLFSTAYLFLLVIGLIQSVNAELSAL